MAKKTPRAPRKDLERRIHFYRADCGIDKQGKPIPFKPESALKHIDGLKFEAFDGAGGRYHQEDDNVYCCWVLSQTRLQFAVIRRDALPTIEQDGIQRALDLPATAGLVEAIHVRVFANNIVGFDFNFYGPRLPRLGRYLNTVAEGYCEKVVFRPLLRQDVVAELEDGKELRMFSLRVHRSHVKEIEEADKSLKKAFETIGSITDADQLAIVIRPRPYSGRSIGSRMMATTRALAKRSDIHDIASAFQVEVGRPGGAAEAIDLLGDNFIVDANILRLSPKGRGLDPSDAFTKIEEAHSQRRDELEKAAALDLS